MPERIVLAEDDRDLRVFLTEVLEDAGYDVVACPTADAAIRVLDEKGEVDLVVTDMIMPGRRGAELLAEVRERHPAVHVILITAFGSIDGAIEMVKRGAFDYLTKPFGTDEFLGTIRRALTESRVGRAAAADARTAFSSPAGFIGASPALQSVFRTIERAARSPHTVLITGESGTGKELVARALHDASGRRTFVATNCAAIPESLLDSELFGHERGAFTGADRERAGLFEAAHGGTLFLDEIAELPATLQPKLLRAIELGEVRRVGASHPRTVDARVIAATNRDLEQEVGAGRFREDLFWRLNVLHIPIPPLRERPSDVPPLVRHFLGGRGITAEAMALLTAYPWPGNVRELRNAIERATTLIPTGEVRAADLPPRIREAGRAAAMVAGASRRKVTLRDLEREYILEILRQVAGNKSRAAEILGLDRKTLYRKLEEYGES
jgi:two-component system, NtrC family, response regulator AtoC